LKGQEGVSLESLRTVKALASLHKNDDVANEASDIVEELE